MPGAGRLEAIVKGMHVRPADWVLEIGCGHGVAASFICERLTDGHFVGIDRSAKMIAEATRRNTAHVGAGRAEFYTADLEAFDPGARRFDKILAVRVGLFHRQRAYAVQIVKPWLAPGGRLTIVFDEP